MSSENEREFNRSDFLKVAPIGVAAGFLVGYMFWQDYVIQNGYDQLNSEKNAVSTVEAGVKQTSDATSYDELLKHLKELPPDTFDSSVMIDFSIKGSVTHTGGGSGTVLEVNRNKKIVSTLVAGHVGDEIDMKLTSVSISQPHNIPKSIIIDPGNIVWVKDDDKDYGILTMNYKNDFTIFGLGRNKIDINWPPNSDEILYSLPFPSSAYKNKRIYPISFRLAENFLISAHGKYTGYLTEQIVGHGASGGAVVRGNGSIVGIFAEIDPDTKGSIICPIDNDVYRMMDDAVAELGKIN